MHHFALAITGSLALAGFHGISLLLEYVPRRYRASLSSASGGAGLAYVVLYLLFELATEGAPKIHALAPLGPEPLETLFILLLFALSVTYVVQIQLEKTATPRDDHRGFMLLFFIYNFLAGAGLVEESVWGTLNLTFYVFAIGLHLVFNDRFLVHRCPGIHTGRWRLTLAVAPVLGCVLARGLNLPAAILYGMLALVAGGTIINVLRNELPTVQDFRGYAFIAGVLAYAALIFATWRF